MAYNELVKNISNIRDYMREFFVYGFKSREEVGIKSARSYDNKRRRIESWLCEYMSFHQEANGKNMFISVDSRRVPHNPLYQAWKAKSFTKNDITLHFWLMDILSPDKAILLSEIMDMIDRDYLPFFGHSDPIDESTLRKKLKEYVDLGLITAEKQGKQLAYRLPCDAVDIGLWRDAICFFAEIDPLGVIGSYLQDKFDAVPEYYAFKHNYLLFAPSSDVMLDLLTAIHNHRCTELELYPNKRRTILPLKIYISTQGGRQYVACCGIHIKRFSFIRLDSIKAVKPLTIAENYSVDSARFTEFQKHLWGVSTGQDGHTEHIEMTLKIGVDEDYIVKRMEREKRCGTVTQISESCWRYSVDVYDAQEMLPWVRTFIGRIQSLTCSNHAVEKRFHRDLAAMTDLYKGNGGENNAV
ncbi:WYL domain-containing protein [Ethanoligenens sp.]|uniref:WYL domain-containing protein n=1 Tax=Ethanoligenens sp. TaxID=2099655 RepID=UPI0039EBB1EC